MARPRGRKRTRSKHVEEQQDEISEPPTKVAKKKHNVVKKSVTPKDAAAHLPASTNAPPTKNNNMLLSVMLPTLASKNNVPMVSPEAVPLPPVMANELHQMEAVVHDGNISKTTSGDTKTLSSPRVDGDDKKRRDAQPVTETKEEGTDARHEKGLSARFMALVAVVWATVVGYYKIVSGASRTRMNMVWKSANTFFNEYVSAEKGIVTEFQMQVSNMFHSGNECIHSCMEQLKARVVVAFTVVKEFFLANKGLPREFRLQMAKVLAAVRAFLCARTGQIKPRMTLVLKSYKSATRATREKSVLALAALLAFFQACKGLAETGKARAVSFIKADTSSQEQQTQNKIKYLAMLVWFLLFVFGTRAIVQHGWPMPPYYKYDAKKYNGLAQPSSEPPSPTTTFDPSPVGLAYVTQKLLDEQESGDKSKRRFGFRKRKKVVLVAEAPSFAPIGENAWFDFKTNPSPIGLAYVTQKLLEDDDIHESNGHVGDATFEYELPHRGCIL